MNGYGIADLYTVSHRRHQLPVHPPQRHSGGVVSAEHRQRAGDVRRSGNLHPIQWTTFNVGLQYYLPFTNGHAFIAGNYGHIESNNIAEFTQTALPNPTVLTFAQASAVVHQADFYDGDLFADIAWGVRLGVEGSYYTQKYVDGVSANDVRLQAAGMFIF